MNNVIEKPSRENNYGLNCKVLKSADYDQGSILLTRSVEMSYFTPAGKARLGTKTTYDVRVQDLNYENDPSSRYNFTSKAVATKYYNSIK